MKTENKDAEAVLLGKFDTAEKQYTEALESYDTDMREKNKERDDTRADLEEQQYLLKQIKEQWTERLEENRRREALALIKKRKEEEQEKQRKTLDAAAQFLQAHYRGMMARREMEKARKGKKGKRRKK